MVNRTPYDSTYRACSLSPDEWEKKADQLMDAASLFQESIQATWKSWSEGHAPPTSDHFISIYFMLVSFAMENLFKAVIVRRDRVKLETEIKSKGKLPSSLKSHDLYNLAKSCGFDDVDAGDEELLKKLSRSAVWYGRYPVPMGPMELEPVSQAKSTKEPIYLASYHSDDDRSIRSWLDHLKTVLHNKTQDQATEQT